MKNIAACTTSLRNTLGQRRAAERWAVGASMIRHSPNMCAQPWPATYDKRSAYTTW